VENMPESRPSMRPVLSLVQGPRLSGGEDIFGFGFSDELLYFAIAKNCDPILFLFCFCFSNTNTA